MSLPRGGRGTRFQARIDGAEIPVWVESLGGTRYAVQIGDEVVVLDARRLEGGAWSVLCGTDVVDAIVDRDGEEPSVRVRTRERTVALEIEDERRQRRRLAVRGGAKGASGTIVAPMPGKIVKALVQPGDVVKAGQGVIVVEAMKMENELRAPRDGVVRSIEVQAGVTVEIRQVLVVID
jgi:biotin carboxyl carrier protein